jgi:flagellar hook-associated protein 3 FlgL
MVQLVPTRLLLGGPMETLGRLQAELAVRQKELASGEKADGGLVHGADQRRAISLRGVLGDIESHVRANGAISARLAAVQSSLGNVAESAANFIRDAIAARGAPNGRAMTGAAAGAQLQDLSRLMGTRVGGFAVFAGQNLDAKPLVDFTGDDGAAARAAIDGAFSSHFGFPPSDPAAGALTPVALTAFLDGPFALLFDEASFAAAWSGAGVQPMQAELSPGVTGAAGSSANQQGMRDMAKALAAFSHFSGSQVSDAAFDALGDRALQTLGGARDALTGHQAAIGQAEERVRLANDRLSDLELVTSRALVSMSAADPTETAARINTLLTGIEASYAMTARLQRLSLVNVL